jgi:hypothetical protein
MRARALQQGREPARRPRQLQLLQQATEGLDWQRQQCTMSWAAQVRAPLRKWLFVIVGGRLARDGFHVG